MDLSTHRQSRRRLLEQLAIVIFGLSLLGIGFLAGRRTQPTVPIVPPVINPPVSPLTSQFAGDQVTKLKPGPWGNLETIPIYIEPPEDYLPVQQFETQNAFWFFPDYTPDGLRSLLRRLQVPEDQTTALLATANSSLSPKGLIVSPTHDLIVSLSVSQRKSIYQIVTETPGNPLDKYRLSFPADRFDQQFQNCGLSHETIELVRHLCFPHGRMLFFYDIKTVMETLPTYEEKRLFLKTSLRQRTLLAKLHVTPDSDVKALIHYWARAGWGKDVQPIIESLARVPCGARVDLVHLLPPGPTAELYTFPFPSLNPTDLHKDCHWTAFNFFRDPPDSQFTDTKFAAAKLEAEYYPVAMDPRFGDIVVLLKPPNAIIHSAVYIADNIVFTKNSALFTDPFLLMTIPDMLDTFSGQIPEDEKLTVLYFRNKYY